MKLKIEGAEIAYSPAETEAFGFLSLGESKAVSSKELVEKKYGGDPPYHALANIRAAIDGLSRKIEINREPFFVVKSKRNGPHPIHYWLERRRRS